MSDRTTYLAVFKEFDPASEGIEKLRDLGIGDDYMNVISGVPIKNTILGRPEAITYVSRIGMFGAVMGMLGGLFFVYGSAWLYPLHVGGQSVFPVPVGIIITFELTMLGLMLFSFIGMFVDSGFPSYTPKQYIPEVSDGAIAILFSCSDQEKAKIVDALMKVGAESVNPAEARQL